jgi:hypothetical protein
MVMLPTGRRVVLRPVGVDISVRINNLKTARASRTQNRFAEHIAKFYSKLLFWHWAYFG